VDVKEGTNCYLGTKEESSATLLFGDSFAGQYEPFFDEIFTFNKASFQSVTTNWCAYILYVNYVVFKKV